MKDPKYTYPYDYAIYVLERDGIKVELVNREEAEYHIRELGYVLVDVVYCIY